VRLMSTDGEEWRASNAEKRYGGLKDEDRIFTNIYGEYSYHIDEAMKRGDWYRTKDMVVKGKMQQLSTSSLRKMSVNVK